MNTKIDYVVTTASIATGSTQTAYVNIWFDYNRNGAWGDVMHCSGGPAQEWAVQNPEISLSTLGSHTFTTPSFIPANPHPDQCLWCAHHPEQRPGPLSRRQRPGQRLSIRRDRGLLPLSAAALADTDRHSHRHADADHDRHVNPLMHGSAAARYGRLVAVGRNERRHRLRHRLVSDQRDALAVLRRPDSVPGMVAGGLNFDGVDDYVEVADDPHSTSAR